MTTAGGGTAPSPLAFSSRRSSVTLVIIAALALSLMSKQLSPADDPSKSNYELVSKQLPPADDHPSSHAKFATEDHVSEVTYLGTTYGGWAFDEKLAGPSPVVYSFGLGEDKLGHCHDGQVQRAPFRLRSNTEG